ncbi:hypothetical protein [Lysinibacillus xylanilyticus]|uniref:hypothetical protein n=1 Tax=Lysinibacillus xylanilyticus TaxID=582475 RepID=UPI003D966794
MAIEFRLIDVSQRNKTNYAPQPGKYLYKDQIQFSGNVKAAYVSLCGFTCISDSPMKEIGIRAYGKPMPENKSLVEVQIIANGANDDKSFYGDIEYTVIAELE